MPEDDHKHCDCRNGQREVTDVWARQEAGIPRDADLAALRQQATLERAELDRARAAHEPLPETPTLALLAKYASARSTVFPCPTCRPAQFRRWRHGCYRPGHVARTCKLCREASAA